MEKNVQMPRQVGVCIDHKKAVVVFLHGGLGSVKVLLSDVESKHKSTGGTRSSRPFWHRSVESANRQDLHRREGLRRFYEAVGAAIGGCDELVVGHAAAKEEFLLHFLAQAASKPVIRASMTVAHLTEPQIVALVREQFGVAAPRRIMNTAGAPFQE